MSVEFVEKEERKQEVGYEYGIKLETRSARNTDRQTDRIENIHTRTRHIETGK